MILIDTGPLVTLHDHEDSWHLPCATLFDKLSDQPSATTWACFTEAMYLLGHAGGYHFQARLWLAWKTELLQLLDVAADETDRARTMMEEYGDHPMDLADATLVAVADFRGLRKVFTLDTHFFAYRLRDGSVLDVILPGHEQSP
jgi:predicted nucleic acid-binding protein